MGGYCIDLIWCLPLFWFFPSLVDITAYPHTPYQLSLERTDRVLTCKQLDFMRLYIQNDPGKMLVAY